MEDIRPELRKMNKERLIKLIGAYDDYIQNANDENRYADGFRPVCVMEYNDCELNELS